MAEEKQFTCAVKVGEIIPDFTLKAYHKDDCTDISFKDARGKWLILFFYPCANLNHRQFYQIAS